RRSGPPSSWLSASLWAARRHKSVSVAAYNRLWAYATEMMKHDPRQPADLSGRARAADHSIHRSLQAKPLLRRFFDDLARDMRRQVRCRQGAGASVFEDDDFMPLPW